jgi:hypothetical protein
MKSSRPSVPGHPRSPTRVAETAKADALEPDPPLLGPLEGERTRPANWLLAAVHRVPTDVLL